MNPVAHDPTPLARYSRLALRTREVMAGLLGGRHRSPFKGFSVEFAEHRQYYPGDEIRHIDWRVFGKTDRYFIKEYEEETNLKAYLVVDASGSMGYAGQGRSKYAYASEVAIVLGYLLLEQRDAVGLFLHDQEVRTALPPSTQSGHWLRLAKALHEHRPGGETGLGRVWQRLAERIPRRSLIVLLSDAFAPIEDVLHALRRLRHARNEVILLQILAPEEIEFPFRRGARFRGLEDGRELPIDPLRVRNDYLQAFARFQEELASHAARMHVDHQLLRTDRPVETCLGEFLSQRAGRT